MQTSYQTLIQKLNKFIREYYKNLIIRGVIYSSLSLVSILIILVTVEHFNFFNRVVRGALFWSYSLVALFFVARFIIIPAIKMFRLSAGLTHDDAAKIIGKHFSEVADKLTNILELNEKTEGNEDLIRASIDQKIKQIEGTTFTAAIDWAKTIYYSKYLLIPVGIILIIIISGNHGLITDSTFRIIKYNTHFQKPAPFYFTVANDSLVAIEKESFTLRVSVDGTELPREAYINYKNQTKKMTKESATTYSYGFKNIQKNTAFHLSANNERSKEYILSILGRPEIENMEIMITPPLYTNLKKRTIQNTGSINVPKGSQILWKIRANKSDTLGFNINGERSLIKNQIDGQFQVKKTIEKDSKYEISLANKNVSFIDTIFYNIKTIPDAHPTISLSVDSIGAKNNILIRGLIGDDYGLWDLRSVKRIYGEKKDTTFITNIDLNKGLRSQSFLEKLTQNDSILGPGDSMEIYFVVRDNDSSGGYKSTQSETLSINAPTKKEILDDYEKQNNAIKTTLTAEIEILKDLEKELLGFQKELIEKDSLDWRDKKRLEEILEKQKDLESKINTIKTTSRSNFEQLNVSSPPSEEILKKQQALEKLFNEIMPEEMKELYQELNELKEELNKNELQQKLKDLQLSNEDLEKELDRNLEILKQIEFDQKLETIIDKIDKLKKSQLSMANEKEKSVQEKIENQKKDLKEFQEIQDEILDMKKLNQELENKNKIPETKNLQTEIEAGLNDGKENLEKKNKKKASKSQKETSEKLSELSAFLKNMQEENNENQHYEDMDVLRQILENLVYFSIEEERILLEFEQLDKNDPKYVELMHTQQALRDAARIIEDSLFALSKRVPQVSSKINREINAIDSKAASAIDNLRERLTLKAIQDQQFIMTSANNLAVLLSGILEDMQEDMASDMPSTQQCEKPGKGAPKPGDLKKMQEELGRHLKEMQEKMKNGQNNNNGQTGMSKKLVEMLAKQELIRQSLEELKGEMKDKNGLKSLQDAIEEMKKTEEDIANKQLTLESLSRQKNILTRMLEVEESMREQGEDEERESRSADDEYNRVVQDEYEKYNLEKLKQVEMLKTAPPSLNMFYKNKVDRYFKLMLE